MTTWSQDAWLRAWNFAAAAHVGQQVPGTDQSYLRHIGAVVAEVMAALAARDDVERPDLAIQCAILHDVVEDTPVTIDEIAAEFGSDVAAGVAALTKADAADDESADGKAERMRDSLDRIRRCPPEVWMVKLADRITNLQPPPAHWTEAKIAAYRAQAVEIHEALQEACPILGSRLATMIEAYPPADSAGD